MNLSGPFVLINNEQTTGFICYIYLFEKGIDSKMCHLHLSIDSMTVVYLEIPLFLDLFG
jgi:hypothetical protein